MYQYNLVLKKTGHSEWTIYTDAGLLLHVLNRCQSEREAVERAEAWASSWTSVSVRIEE